MAPGLSRGKPLPGYAIRTSSAFAYAFAVRIGGNFLRPG